MAATGPPPSTESHRLGDAAPSGGTPSHKRVYQACIPCRRRKVRCDLGSVDEPHDPPCQRCRRESKECYFSATRRKRRPADGGEGEFEDEIDDDYGARNARKRLRRSSERDDRLPPDITIPRHTSSTSTPATPSGLYRAGSAGNAPQPLTPGGSRGQAQPLRRPNSDTHSSLSPRQPYSAGLPRKQSHAANASGSSPARAEAADDDQHLTNRLWEAEVYSGHDALNLLFEAAGRTGDIGRHRPETHGSANHSPVAVNATPGRPTTSSANDVGRRTIGGGKADNMGPPSSRPRPEILLVDPAIRGQDPGYESRSIGRDDEGLQDALKAWSRLRFVRAGWFTAREAMDYIDYFYSYMVPLTPVLPPTYHSPSTHPKLLTEEPILTITLLTISSRYMQLTGRGGRSRSYAIHEKLWTYLRGMIERMVWGQEQFGSGAGGSAASDEAETQTSSTAPWRGLKKGSLRTLGTVESLMLLTEWHPRALHFPPGDDGDELIVKEERWPAEDAGADVADGEGGFRSQKGIGGKRIENWLEPAWRSDRMCWMLLGNALALAFELGVFDRTPEMPSPGGDTQRPDRESLSYRLREQRVQKLLYVYVTQLAGRLEWTSMVGNLPGLRDMGRRLGEHVHVDVVRANAADLSDGSPMDDAILNCWIDITDLMKSGNERLFPTRKVTRELIRSGSYVSLLEDFAPMLRGWRENFNALRMPDYIRCVLEIEFEYVRVYINSLALQAVVERCTSNAGNGATPGPTTDAATPNPRDRTGSIAFSSLMGFQDQEYIKEVVDASRNLLRTVVEGLLPGDYLKHCPVRTYFRIVSGAMFLLKTFALGAKEDDVAISLGLMDSTVEALRECIVDDVHLGVRFADLLEVLTMRIRSRFVRMATGGGNRGESRSPAPAHRAQDQAEQATWQVADADPDGGNNTGYLLPPRGDGTRTPNPLFGISTASVDPDDLNVSIMPPPPGSFNFTPSYNSNNVDANGNLTIGGGVSDDGSAYPADWLGLDLNPLLNYGGGGVGAGGGASQAYGSGVSVGGFDLLEVLLNDMEGNGV